MAATDLKVIIAGCGIGGLSAAIALELAGIDYTILEESPALDSDLKPGASATNVPTKTTHVGGAIQVAPTAIHFLSQLGIYDEMKEISKPVSGLSMNEHDMNYVGRIDLSTHRERQVSLLLFIVYLFCECSCAHARPQFRCCSCCTFLPERVAQRVHGELTSSFKQMNAIGMDITPK